MKSGIEDRFGDKLKDTIWMRLSMSLDIKMKLNKEMELKRG